jgi:branched-chain amino acid transport system substrate-binding protein
MDAPARWTRLAALLLLAASGVVLSACQLFRRQPIVIGAAGPFKLPYGLMNLQGIQLAVDQVNAAGGVHGRPLELLIRDDGAEEPQAVAIAHEFVDNPRVAAVVGHMSSGAQLAAANVYDGHLVSVATTASSAALTGISPWVFRVISSDSANGAAFARFATGNGLRRAAVIYDNTSYGRGLAVAFQHAFDGTIVAFVPITEDSAMSFEPYVSYVKAQTADAVFLATTQDPAVAMLREMRRQRVRPAFMTVGGSSWESAVNDSALSEGIYLAAPFDTHVDRSEVTRFVDAFRAKFQRDPDGDAALAYDATMAIVKALDAVGPSRRRIRDFLHALTGAGVTGPLRFERSGDPAGRSFVFLRAHHHHLEVLMLPGGTPAPRGQ